MELGKSATGSSSPDCRSMEDTSSPETHLSSNGCVARQAIQIATSAHIDDNIVEAEGKPDTNEQQDEEELDQDQEYPLIRTEKTFRRSLWQRLLGKTIIFLSVISWLLSGFLISFIQLIVLCFIKLSPDKKWRRFFKEINSYLLYVQHAFELGSVYYWADVHLNMVVKDKQLVEDAKKPLLGIMIPNHSFQLDFMMCLILADQFGKLTTYKTMAKNELKYLPIVGWSLWFSDIVFVKRNWLKDKLSLGKQLNELFDYEGTLLGIFAEGTRWTAAKYEASVEWAQANNIKPYKHHLTPRVKGFRYSVRHLLRQIEANQKSYKASGSKEVQPDLRIFNLQILVPTKPTFRDFINGEKLEADCYVEEVELTPELKQKVLEASPDDDECPELDKLLYDLYRRKDQTVDRYIANGNKVVPEAGDTKAAQVAFRRKKLPLVIWVGQFVITHAILAYLTFVKYANSWMFKSMLVVVVLLSAIMWHIIQQESSGRLNRAKTKRKAS